MAWNDVILMFIPMLVMAEGIQGLLIVVNRGMWNYCDLELLLGWLYDDEM
jgi:hypothetical protein